MALSGAGLAGLVAFPFPDHNPGLGGLLYGAVLGKDIFVINGVVTVLILSLAVTVFLIDMLYPLIDPRIRHSR